MTDREFTVQLDISAAAYESLYRGDARTVVAHDARGRRIQFPAAALRPFVTHAGISGVFVIRVDARNKLVDICRTGV
jgi:hypothetical protein